MIKSLNVYQEIVKQAKTSENLYENEEKMLKLFLERIIRNSV